MRLLHVLDHSVPLHSGYAFRTLGILRQQRARGWQTHHLTTPKQGATASLVEEVDGLIFHRTPPPRLAGPVIGELALMRAVERRLETLIDDLRPDILHAHSPALTAVPAIRAGRRKGVPVVYEIRAFWEDAAASHGTSRPGSLRYRLTRRLETWAVTHADAVTTIAAGLRDDLVARGVPPGKITVVPNAVDRDTFRTGAPPDRGLARELGLEGCTVLGFLGSFYRYEGLDILLRALPRIATRHPRVRLLLVGGGPEEERLKALARDLGLAETVRFAGRVPHDRIGAYYGLVNLLVFPRTSIRLTELVTPLKPLEAMAMGKPVLASDVGGHRELVRDGRTGWLAPPDDPEALAAAVDRVLADRPAWPEVLAAAEAFVTCERSWPVVVARYESVYAPLVRRLGAAAPPRETASA